MYIVHVGDGYGYKASAIDMFKIEYMEGFSGLKTDIMLEVKDKEISAIKCIASLDKALKNFCKNRQWQSRSIL